MASPVLNYTGPTGLSRMYSGPVPVGVSVNLDVGFGRQVVFLPRLVFFGATFIAAQPSGFRPLFDVVNGKIPPPPLGRLIFSTFPPIYRERNAMRPSSGQVWPRYSRSAL